MPMQTRYAPGCARLIVWLCASLWTLSALPVHAQRQLQPCRQSEVRGWVAELPKKLAKCPAPDFNWKLRTFPLAEDKTRQLCSYEWRSARKPTKDGLPAGLDYTADCMAIGVFRKEQPFEEQPDGATDADIAAIQDDYLDAIDAPERASRAKSILGDAFPTLAFIDALPVTVDVPQDGAIQHGNSLATMAKLVGGCTDASCRFEFGWLSKPALFPHDRGDVAGSPLDTADALLETLKSYRANPGEHLVLSLGLGFEADARCASQPNSPVVSALREAIRRVACATDAIVLAPVGNKRLDDVTTGMLYPAKLSTEELICDGEPRGRPLVVAISGVDHRLKPLYKTRANAPLMTIGGPFAYEGSGPEERLNPRTASSVAVAAAGPIFSLAWYLRPELDAAGLVAALTSAGTASAPAVSGSKVIRACRTWETLCGKSKQAGRCAELTELCGEVTSTREPALQLVAATPAPEADAEPLVPTYCIGRGQRIEPAGPGE